MPAESDSSPPTRLNIALGLLGLAISFFGLYCVFLYGAGLRVIVQGLRMSPEPQAVVLLGVAWFIEYYWFLPVSVLTAFYLWWVVRSRLRMMVFNVVCGGVLCIVLPLAAWTHHHQKLVISEYLRKR